MPQARQRVIDPMNGIHVAPYIGLTPYVIAPEFYWSLGSWVPNRPGGLNELPVELTEGDFEYLAQQGYCAILYDRLIAREAIAAGASLEGQVIQGVRFPDFASNRFEVYLLTPS